MAQRSSAGFSQRVREEGGATAVRQGLGEMPLTLFLIVAGVVLWLYIRRASLGIDKHPGEARSVPVRATKAPPVLPLVTLQPSQRTVGISPSRIFIPAQEFGFDPSTGKEYQ
jgi:hypothetical protein